VKKCRSCQTEIDAKATKCPHCQTDQRNFINKHPILSVIGVLFIVGFLINLGKTPTPTDTTPIVKQENTAGVTTIPTGITTPTDPQPTTTSTNGQPTVPTEYKSALYQAAQYSDIMHMSKRGVYAQLVSEYGGKFSPEAAQYAIDYMLADWNANALVTAKTYQDVMKMSPASIHDQLVSEYGGKFTQAEADYAIQHLND
jgi:hypothetical protein